MELAQAEDYASYKSDLVLSLPKESCITEEIWDILIDMFRTSISPHQIRTGDLRLERGAKGR